MDLQEKELIEETLEISKENNKMLKKIWRDVKYKRFVTFIYWTVIIGFSLGAYYYVQPYVEGLLDTYTGISQAAKGVGGTLDTVNQGVGASLDLGSKGVEGVQGFLNRLLNLF